VFFLCGLWHGAAYTFVVWGLYHGALLVIERLYQQYFGTLPRGALAWGATFLLVMIGWVLFRSPTLPDAVHYIAVLFGAIQHEEAIWSQSFLSGEKIIVLGAGLFFSLAKFDSYDWTLDGSRLSVALKGSAALLVFTYSIMLLSFRSFNPFIY